MQRLSLTKRPAKIGPSINTRTERHGEEEHPALDIPLLAIPITETEVGEILGDPGSYDALFTKDRSKFAEPRWIHVPYVPFDQKFKGAKVTIQVNGSKLVFRPATVQKIKFYLIGSAIAMWATVSAEPPEDGVDVLELLNMKCDVAILNGAVAEKPENQAELGLEGGGPNVSDEGDGTIHNDTLADVEREEAEATASATGQRIGRSSRKKK